MEGWILDVVNQFGYFGIALLIAVENIFPPIPSEVILTFGGFLTTQSSLQILWVIVSATVGSVLGAVVLYLVGRFLNRDRLERWVDGRLGKILRLKKEDIKKAERWFDRRGKLTVFFCRFIPVVRSLISIPAGMAKMPVGIFLVLTTFGTAIWNVVLVLLGAWAGSSWETIVGYIDRYSTVVVVLLIVAVVVFCALWFYRRSRKKQK